MNLQADCINGVYVVDDFEGEVLSQEYFYDCLSDLPEDNVICCEADEAMIAKIDQEYGVHQ